MPGKSNSDIEDAINGDGLTIDIKYRDQVIVVSKDIAANHFDFFCAIHDGYVGEGNSIPTSFPNHGMEPNDIQLFFGICELVGNGHPSGENAIDCLDLDLDHDTFIAVLNVADAAKSARVWDVIVSAFYKEAEAWAEDAINRLTEVGMTKEDLTPESSAVVQVGIAKSLVSKHKSFNEVVTTTEKQKDTMEDVSTLIINVFTHHPRI